MKAYNKKLLANYKNGNYIVKIYSDGTKIRYTNKEEFESLFPESIDIKITNYCDSNCSMCHELSDTKGKHARIDHKFLTTLKRGTELAIGGGNPLAHPELFEFLSLMKIKGVICNITINQLHFGIYKDYLQELIDKKLIYGLGISVNNSFLVEEIINFSKINRNVVIHLIAGIIDDEIINLLKDNELKILILGYKQFGRGINYYSEAVKNKISYLKDNLIDISKYFDIVSFDNLAINQLDIKNQIGDDDYNSYYMGDDGMFTMYIDLVNEEFAASSITKKRHKILDSIEEMFKIVKETKEND